MIMRKVVSKFRSTIHIKKQHNTYYDTIYEYSKLKLLKLLLLPSFKRIFLHYIDSGSFEEMLQTDKTLSINVSGYRKRASKLTDIILKGVEN
jgi:hypothetical protein